MKKILFCFFLLQFAVLTCFLYHVLDCRHQTQALQQFFLNSSELKICQQFPESETIKTTSGIYICYMIPPTRLLFPNGIVVIKMPSGKTRGFYAGHSFGCSLLTNIKRYAITIINEDPEYIIKEKKELNIDNAIELSLEILMKNTGYEEL